MPLKWKTLSVAVDDDVFALVFDDDGLFDNGTGM